MINKALPELFQKHFPRTIKLLLLCIFGGTLSAFISVVVLQNFTNQNITYLLVGLLTFLTVSPLVLRFLSRSFDLVEPSIWFALFYLTHFGIRALYDLKFGSQILGLEPATSDLGLINAALLVAIIGLGAFWLGYHLGFGSVISNSLPILPYNWNCSLALPVALCCFLFGWGIRGFLINMQAGSLREWLSADKYSILTQAQGTTYLNTLSSLTMIALMIILILARVYKSYVYWLLFLLGTVPEIIYLFFSGSRSQLIFFFLGILVVLYMSSLRGHNISVRYAMWATLLILMLFLLFPFFSFLRAGETISPGLLMSRTIDFWTNPITLFEVVWARQHGLDSLAIIIDRVPKEEPYTLCSELSLLLVAWVPREFLPDKPTISIGKVFYERFFPPIFHAGTSVAVTLPGEFYWAFGVIGVIIGMFLIGVLWRFFWSYLVLPKANLSNILIVSVMFQSFFTPLEQTVVDVLTIHLFKFFLVMLVTIFLRGKTATLRRA